VHAKFVLPKSREPIFKNLKELICDIPWVTAPMLRSLVSVLEHCPNLEKLEINVRFAFLANAFSGDSFAHD